MIGYNWTDAGTQQGRDRLKELLDSGVEVVTSFAPHGLESPNSTMMSYCHAGKYKIQGFRYDPMPNIDVLESLFFLDPSPRLEPSELQWKRCFDKRNLQATDTWVARDGVYHYSAFPDGNWTVSCLDNGLTGFAGSGNSVSAETAKAAIHEWRVNHLKSMIENGK